MVGENYMHESLGEERQVDDCITVSSPPQHMVFFPLAQTSPPLALLKEMKFVSET